MKQIKHLTTMICIALMALAVFWTIQKEALADTKPGSITVRLHELKTPKNDVKFTAYFVGGWNGTEGKWELDESLAQTGVDLENLTSADELEIAARKLIMKGNLEELEAVNGQTDDSGTMVLSDLKWGIYLLKQQSGEEVYGTVSPFLVTIPSFDEDGTRTIDLTVEPKAQAPIKKEAGRIEVTKRVGYLDPELFEIVDLIPEDATYYVGIFRDRQGYIPYGTNYIKPIHMKGISTGTAVFSELEAGTYYIFETDSKGNVYQPDELQPGEPYSWICQVEDGSTQEITLDGKANTPAGKVGFYNLYYDLPEGYRYKASINIEKKVLNENEEQIEVNDTFYAGIFRDKEGTDLYQVAELVQNDTVTISVPLGGEEGQEPITYYIFETDKDGNLLDKSTFPYEVSGEDSVDVTKGNLTGDVSLTNVKQETEESTEIEEEDGDDSDDSDKSNNSDESKKSKKKSSSRKTGDDTPITLYVVMLAVALMAVVIMTRSRILKGRKKHE